MGLISSTPESDKAAAAISDPPDLHPACAAWPEMLPAELRARKVRQPAARFKRKRRDPTPQELEALKRANAARQRAAAERRGAEQRREDEKAG